jgi:TonB family protein
MNKMKMLVGAALLSGLLSTSAFAAGVANDASATEATYTKPEPAKIVSPEGLPRRCLDTTVKVAFTVDEFGQPRDITLVGRKDRELARSLIPAIAQWRFTPATKDGSPVSQRVVMPLKLVADT